MMTQTPPASLGETLLELLAVPVGVGALDLGLDLVHAAGDLALLAVAVDDRRVVLGDDDAAGLAEDGEVGLVEAEPDLRRDDLATGEDGDVLQHGLAAVTEAGALTAATLKVPRILLTTSVERPRRRRPRR